MRGSWLVARSDLRQRWGSVVALTLVIGLVGAVVLTGLAGARRTSTAFGRFRTETKARDLTVFLPVDDRAAVDTLRELPGVEAIGRARPLVGTLDGIDAQLGGPLDSKVGVDVERPRLVEGRRPRQDRIHEIVLPEPFARARGVALGDTLTLHGYTQDEINRIATGGEVRGPRGPKVALHVVGITRAAGDLSIEGATGGLVFVTRAFVDRYRDEIGTFAPVALLVRLTDHDAARAFVREARTLTASRGASGQFQVQPSSDTDGAVRQSIDVLGIGLLVFAAVVAAAALVVTAIALRRYVEGGVDAAGALRALGFSRRERVVAVVGPLAFVALGAGAVAVFGAWLASPLMPIGLARQAEPDPGMAADGLVFAAGFVAVAAVVLGTGWWAGRRAVRVALPDAARTGPGTSAATRAVVSVGFSPPVTVGVTMATESGRGRTAVPVLPAMAGAVVAVLGVVAVGVFGAGLAHLAVTPRAYGYNWDAHVEVVSNESAALTAACTGARPALADDPAVRALAAVCSNSVEVDGHPVGAYAFVRKVGRIEPTVIDGRAPRARNEIALGSDTFAAIGGDIGDTVTIAGPEATRRYRVVGRVVLPWLGNDADVQSIADGVILTGPGLSAISSTNDVTTSALVVRWRPGTDAGAARARLVASGGGTGMTAVAPLEVDRLEQLDGFPWVLGAGLALIGVLGVGYTLITAIRRRARDFAVLRTVGFRRRQVVGSVATQATVYAVVGLVIGVPLGVFVGRLVWRAVAEDAGLLPDTPVPVLLVAAITLATLVVVNLIAVLPARAAARTRPAVVLRSE